MAAALMTGSLAGCGQETSKSSDTTTISVWTGDSHSKKLYDELVSNWNNTTGKEKGIYIDYQVKSGDSVGYPAIKSICPAAASCSNFASSPISQGTAANNLISFR